MRLRSAVTAFQKGDASPELATEFDFLARAGIGEGYYYLGLMHEDGTNGFCRNLEIARELYQKAIDTSEFIEGYLALARMLYFGVGSPPDFACAFALYARVADASDNLIACFMLGRMYQLGQGVDKDHRLARMWYGRAVGKGSMWGMFYFATLEAEERNWLAYVKLRFLALRTAWVLRKRRPLDVRLRPS